MKNVTTKDLNSLHQWMEFIVNDKDVALSDIDSNLKMFEDGDDAYLVINIYDGDSSSTEYYFKPDTSINGLLALVSMLSGFNFSVEQLLNELPFKNYEEDEAGFYWQCEGIKVFKEGVVSN